MPVQMIADTFSYFVFMIRQIREENQALKEVEKTMKMKMKKNSSTTNIPTSTADKEQKDFELSKSFLHLSPTSNCVERVVHDEGEESPSLSSPKNSDDDARYRSYQYVQRHQQARRQQQEQQPQPQ